MRRLKRYFVKSDQSLIKPPNNCPENKIIHQRQIKKNSKFLLTPAMRHCPINTWVYIVLKIFQIYEEASSIQV